ncbi:hypothetical protein V6Z11_A10G206000 [Gossypium hirsutum]
MGMDGGVCDGAGGRQHGRVGVVLVADSMGKWEELFNPVMAVLASQEDKSYL